VPGAAAKPARRRRPRGSINADDIVAGAFEVARRASLDQLSMPVLAEHLDVGVASIYWYFLKKEDLLNRMTDLAVNRLIQAFPPVPDDLPWPEFLHDYFKRERTIFRDDQVMCDLVLVSTSTYSKDAARRLFEREESVLARLAGAGFSAENAFRVFNAVSVYTRGMVIHERILQRSKTPTLDTARQRQITDWSSMPLLERMLDRHPLAGTTDEDFEFGLAGLVSGFETLLREQEAG